MEATFTSISRSGPTFHPIFEKFNFEHVTQFLNNVRDRDQEEARFRRTGRWFRLGYVIMAIILFAALTVFLLPDEADLYFKLLQGLGVFGAGLAGGYGIRTYQERRGE